MLDAVVAGDVADSDFPWDCRSGDTMLQAALAECLEQFPSPFAGESRV